MGIHKFILLTLLSFVRLNGGVIFEVSLINSVLLAQPRPSLVAAKISFSLVLSLVRGDAFVCFSGI